MNFFGVGTTEMLIILVVLLVVFGPKDLPEVAKKIGSKVGEFRRIMDTANNEMATMLESAKKLEDMQGIQPAVSTDISPAVIPNTPEETHTIAPPSIRTIPDMLPPDVDGQLLASSSSLPNVEHELIMPDTSIYTETPAESNH